MKSRCPSPKDVAIRPWQPSALRACVCLRGSALRGRAPSLCRLCLRLWPVGGRWGTGGEEGRIGQPSRLPLPPPLEAWGKLLTDPPTLHLGPAAWGRSRADRRKQVVDAQAFEPPLGRKIPRGLPRLPEPKPRAWPSQPDARPAAPPSPSQAKGPGVPCQPWRERDAGGKGHRDQAGTAGWDGRPRAGPGVVARRTAPGPGYPPLVPVGHGVASGRLAGLEASKRAPSPCSRSFRLNKMPREPAASEPFSREGPPGRRGGSKQRPEGRRGRGGPRGTLLLRPLGPCDVPATCGAGDAPFRAVSGGRPPEA